GSFEQWCEWVRDPLLTLGCRDPVERVEVIKGQDPHRQHIAELFRVWDRHHGNNPVKVAELHEDVQRIADPQSRGRPYLATFVGQLAGTRAAGFVLTRQDAVGRWGAATYALIRSGTEGVGHRDHRDHREYQTPTPPMPPMPDDLKTSDLFQEEEESWTG